MRSEKSQKLRAEYFYFHRLITCFYFPIRNGAFRSEVPQLQIYKLFKENTEPNAVRNYVSSARAKPANPSCATFIPATRLAKLSFFVVSQSSFQSRPYSIPAINVSPAPIVLQDKQESLERRRGGLTQRLRSQVQNKPGCGLEW